MGMNSSWKLCSLLIIVLVLCVHEGLSLKCWVCRSDIDPGCGDPFDNSSMPLTECIVEPGIALSPAIKSPTCRKIRQKVNGETRIIRSCASLDGMIDVEDDQHCQPQTSKHKIFIEYCSCKNKDGCNAGPTVYSNHFIIASAAFFACFINRF